MKKRRDDQLAKAPKGNKNIRNRDYKAIAKKAHEMYKNPTMTMTCKCTGCGILHQYEFEYGYIGNEKVPRKNCDKYPSCFSKLKIDNFDDALMSTIYESENRASV